MEGKVLVALIIGLSIESCLASEPSSIFFNLECDQIDIKAEEFMSIIKGKELSKARDVYCNLARVLDKNIELWSPNGLAAFKIMELARYDKKDPLKNCNHEEFAKFREVCKRMWWEDTLDMYCRVCIQIQLDYCALYGPENLFNYVSRRRMKSRDDEAKWTVKDGIKAYMKGQLDSSERRHLIDLCADYIEGVMRDMATIHDRKQLDYPTLVEQADRYNKLVWEQCNTIQQSQAK